MKKKKRKIVYRACLATFIAGYFLSTVKSSSINNDINLNSEKVIAGFDIDEIIDTSVPFEEIEKNKNEFFEQIKKEEKLLKKLKLQREKIVEKYANVYNLNEEKTTGIVEDKTNLFNDNSLKNKKNDNEMELKILKLVKDIKDNPDFYNVNLSDISEYDYKKNSTIREMVYHYAELFGVDKIRALSIELYETGYYKAPIATSYNNPGALRGQGDFYRYENLEAGIISHMNTLLYYQNDTIDGMQSAYSGDGSIWSDSVKYFYGELSQDENAFTLYDEEKKVLKKK